MAPHDHAQAGHNHDHADHLHSHPHRDAQAEDIQALATAFIDGFRKAADKTSYLRLAGVPFEREALKLVDVRIESEWQVGTASPAFGTRSLSYLPLPGEMVRERENMRFVYVSLDARQDVDLRDFLSARHG